MWRYFFLIVKLLKITNMSNLKIIRAAELYAGISEDKHSNRAMIFTKHDMVDSFVSGAEFMKKEYEEKLSWVPVDEKLPPICTHVETKYKNTRQYYFHLENGEFENCPYNPTHWRLVL